jgi:hypothetical protein
MPGRLLDRRHKARDVIPHRNVLYTVRQRYPEILRAFQSFYHIFITLDFFMKREESRAVFKSSSAPANSDDDANAAPYCAFIVD